MTVDLLPNYDRSSLKVSYEPLTTAPNYVRSSKATRWHRARSGHTYPNGRITYWYWCGSNYGDLGVESIGPDEPVCATCEGRYLAQLEQQQRNPWRFDPIKGQPSRWCPASGTGLVPAGTRRYFLCLVCADPVAWRATGGLYNLRVTVVKHAPGEGLIQPCRYHGWYRLTLADDDTVRCGCEGGGL